MGDTNSIVLDFGDLFEFASGQLNEYIELFSSVPDVGILSAR